jgi:hypothetical protein
MRNASRVSRFLPSSFLSLSQTCREALECGGLTPLWIHGSKHQAPSSAMPDSKLDRLWKRIDALDSSDKPRDPLQFGTVIHDVVAHAEAQSSAEAWYAAGYASYLHPQRRFDEAIRRQTEEYLSKALFLRPGYAFPLLYLAYHHFDFREYPTTLTFACAFEISELDGHLMFECAETRVALLLHLSRWKEAEEALRQAEALTIDSEWSPFTSMNLERALDAHRNSIPTDLRTLIVDSLKRIDRRTFESH